MGVYITVTSQDSLRCFVLLCCTFSPEIMFDLNNIPSLLGGNYGIPLSQNVVYEMNNKVDGMYHIVELSSFHLEDTNYFNPYISCLLKL